MLTRQDALAFLRLRKELSGGAKVAFGVWMILGGAVFGLLPPSLTGPPDGVRFILIFAVIIGGQFGILLLGRAVWRHWRARQMVPRPRPALFEEWIDCVAGTEIDRVDEAYLSPELIGQVLDTPTHIFVLNHNTSIVVPTRAFADRAEARAMVAHLRSLAAGPYYFDP